MLTALPVACVDETDTSTAEMSAQISREHVTFPHFCPHLSITLALGGTSLSMKTAINVSSSASTCAGGDSKICNVTAVSLAQDACLRWMPTTQDTLQADVRRRGV